MRPSRVRPSSVRPSVPLSSAAPGARSVLYYSARKKRRVKICAARPHPARTARDKGRTLGKDEVRSTKDKGGMRPSTLVSGVSDMTRIFLTLAALDGLALIVTYAVGWVSRLRHGVLHPEDPIYLIHFSLGLFTAILTFLVHCLIFTYFLGTGR